MKPILLIENDLIMHNRIFPTLCNDPTKLLQCGPLHQAQDYLITHCALLVSFGINFSGGSSLDFVDLLKKKIVYGMGYTWVVR